MAFDKHKKKQTDYKISIKSDNGNTIAFVNLTDQFIKAVTGKTKKDVTFDDISKISNGQLMEFLLKNAFVLEPVEPEETITAEEF